MDDGLNPGAPRGEARTSLWTAECKDCRAEQAAQAGARPRGRDGKTGGKGDGGGPATSFEYSGGWARRKLDRGESRSDRCERHRRSHASAINAFAVPYVDLRVIAEVADPTHPSGPLGGLGALPVLHSESPRSTNLAGQPFGMTDGDILTLLEGLSGRKRVAVVEAGTGTGKSTFMPFRLMSPPEGAAYRPTDFGPIVVTEPRRVAATGVARFVGEDLCNGCDSRKCSRHVGPGFQVGYQVSGERHWDAACELIYVTDGTMINWVRDGQLATMSMVIIDEAHERSENIDIILAQLRELLRQHEHLRVIIASATLDRDFFVSYFGGPEEVFLQEVPATKSFGYGTPLFLGAKIDEAVIANGLEIAPGLKFPGWAADEAGGEDPRKTTQSLAELRCVAEMPAAEWRIAMPEAVVRQVVEIARGTEWGDILAFLPTSDTIQRTVGRIRAELDDLDLDFDVYPLLASTPKATTEKAIAARSRGDRRKIVISSNLAETSLTVKGVRYVVDSGLICQEEFDSSLASGSFPTKPHSQSALRQRWGRVGRDMPGWVFPLYTTEQFLSLARNTPPETSQKNLESHYMKLLSSGLDPDEMPLPGGHAAEGAEIDQAGRDYIAQFERESARARGALAAAGAIDADGHLTEFGRDIERFAGDGASALAIMLADQMACAHEVILALTVLGEGHLCGNHTEAGKADYILAVDEGWPAAWRVRAARAHRGLALGCRDELDVLLRVVRLYQDAPDRHAWCARWWVNGGMIDTAIDAMMAQVDALSAAMKADASRAIMPELAGRARAVLSRAMVSARYRRVPDGTYVAVGGSDAEPARLGTNVLVDAPEHVIALSRFRRGRAREDGKARPAEISHVVEFLSWAALDGASPQDLGMDLVMRTSEHLSSSIASDDSIVLGVLDAVPIGSVCDLQVEAGAVLAIDHVAPPFACPVAAQRSPGLPDGRGGSGFDRDWDPGRARLGETPEEEGALEIIKAHDEEVNDDEAKSIAPATPVPPSENPCRFRYRTQAGIDLPAGKARAVVVGYDLISSDEVYLVVEPLAADLVLTDPARHPDVLPWEEITMTVGPLVHDHQTTFRQLDRSDLRGSFFLADWASGLDLFDRSFIARLREGACLDARAVPTDWGAMSVTLLPTARDLLGSAEVETRPRKDERLRVFAAAIVEDVDETGWATVELDHRDPATGLSFRFRVHRNDLEASGLLGLSQNAGLLVGLRPARDDPRKSAAPERGGGTRVGRSLLEAPSEEIATIASGQPALDVKGMRIRAGQRDVPFVAIARLLAASPDARWQRSVWAFYEQTLHLSVAAVYPASARVEVPVRIASLVHFRKEELEARLGVTLFVRRSEASIGIGSNDAAAVQRATRYLEDIAHLPRISVRIGGENVGSRAVEARHDVSYVWIEEGVATIAGSSQRAVADAMRQLVKPARGEITVPQEWIGRFIGTGRANLSGFEAASGCSAFSPLKNNRWELRAPAAADIEMFLALARQKVPAAVGSLLDRGEMVAVADPPRPSPAGPAAAWRGKNPAFFANVPLAELERLAGAKSQLRPLPATPVAPPPAAAKLEHKPGPPSPATSPASPRALRPSAPVHALRPTPKKPPEGFLTAWIRKLLD